MGFSDVFKKSFLEGASASNLTTTSIVVTMLVTAILGAYIFVVYRMICKKVFYSKSFNISLVAIAMITAAIILAIQFSVVISLGMVGALSIVRFRTAIKDPMDLVFLFWSISIGIICGAGLIELGILVSVLLTLVIFVLDITPSLRSPMILVVNGQNEDIEDKLKLILNKYSKKYVIKSRNLTQSGMDMIVEIRMKDNGGELIKEVKTVEGVRSVSLVMHDGEAVS
ncbi:MAG: DUF4956 domain-containing protein [Lachnospiraceae bacterium]|nr:DUF4956 domain-containing protein [Lachnospiraceae bacterium]